jgi:hypothetical protein
VSTPRALALLTSLVGVTLGAPAPLLAAEEIVVLDGEVAEGPPDHVFVEFEVPAGTVEIEVRHDDMSMANILDWGLYDPDGFRGWGGGNAEPAVVGIDAASRSYVPGAIAPGPWSVVIGKAKIAESPAIYHIEVVLRDVATLEPQPERAPYEPALALSDTARWYAGDFHVHSRESGDARPEIDEIATFARGRGLDFVELSDHNVVGQSDFIGAAQPDHPELLLVPGIELTTYAGHANAIGATVWVDHKIGQPDVTIEAAIAAIHDQGALVSINHPALAIGDICIGCAWDHDVDPATIDAVEIATTGLDQAGMLFDDAAIAFWDELCDQGAHAAAIGGSDDHKAGVDLGAFQSPIGDPTTMVYASELSVAALVEGIRTSRTVVKLQGADDPMIELAPARDRDGDTVHADTSVVYDVTVTGGDGFRVRAVRDGEPGSAVDVVGDPFAWSFEVESPADGETRVRVELLADTTRRVVTSHVWQRRCTAELCSDPSGTTGTVDDSGTSTTATTSTTTGVDGGSSTSSSETTGRAGASEGEDGCGCATRSDRPHALALLAALCLRRRRQRHAAQRDGREAENRADGGKRTNTACAPRPRQLRTASSNSAISCASSSESATTMMSIAKRSTRCSAVSSCLAAISRAPV